MTQRTYVKAGMALMVALMMTGPAMARGDGPKRPEFTELDVNGDGQITQAEMDAHRTARFAEIDADGDGAVSAAELRAASERKKEARLERMIERFDKDGDGKLSQAEMPTRDRGGIMERMDSNSDGVLDAEEYAAAPDRGHEHGKGKMKPVDE